MSDENKTQWQEREMGALWEQSGADQDYLSGFVTVDGDKQRVVIFKNKFKSKDGGNSPDWRVYKSVSKENQEQAEPQEIPEALR
tara:strand:+ start:208 stop:459 length:252 start_codon:yes stop_codon:yes gene_type:complete